MAVFGWVASQVMFTEHARVSGGKHVSLPGLEAGLGSLCPVPDSVCEAAQSFMAVFGWVASQVMFTEHARVSGGKHVSLPGLEAGLGSPVCLTGNCQLGRDLFRCDACCIITRGELWLAVGERFAASCIIIRTQSSPAAPIHGRMMPLRGSARQVPVAA